MPMMMADTELLIVIFRPVVSGTMLLVDFVEVIIAIALMAGVP